MLLIRGFCYQRCIFQFFQAVGEDVGRNALGRILKRSIGRIAPEQVSNHKQRPFVTNQVQRAGNGTGGAQETVGFRFWLRLP